MKALWKVAPWLSRMLLLPPAALFGFLGIRYFGDPAGTTAADSISLGSPAAITDMRVVGSIFLACSLVTLFSAVSRDRVLGGLRFVLTVVTAVTLARVYGVLADGSPPQTVTKLKTELVLLVIFSSGLIFETLRHRRYVDRGHEAALDRAMETRR